MSQPPYGTQPPYGGQPPSGGQPPYGGPPNQGGSQAGWGQPTPPPTAPQPPQPAYGPPPTAALPSYGQPTQQYGQPGTGGGYGPPGGQSPYGGGPLPYGSPQPSKRSPVPFVILGLVILLVAGGIGLVLILNKDDPTPVATTTSAESTEPTESTSQDTEPSTEDSSSPSGDEPNFAESEDVAIAFVQLMIDGDYEGAYAALCGDGRDVSDGDGIPDAATLAEDFFAEVGSTTVTGGETTDVAYRDDESDTVTFDLDTDIGVLGLEVKVLEETPGAGDLTICGYDSV